MNINKETVCSKIKKLLAVANDKSISSEEASSFASKAYAMMLEHKIEQTDLKELEANEINIDYNPINNDKKRRFVPLWKQRLATLLGANFGCFISLAGNRLICSGRQSDINSIRYLFGYCEKTIEKLSTKHARGYGKLFAVSFREGCVIAIYQAIETEKQNLAKQQSENALMIININKNAEEAKNFLMKKIKEAPGAKYTENKTKQKNLDPRGFYFGREKGQSIYKGNKEKLK